MPLQGLSLCRDTVVLTPHTVGQASADPANKPDPSRSYTTVEASQTKTTFESTSVGWSSRGSRNMLIGSARATGCAGYASQLPLKSWRWTDMFIDPWTLNVSPSVKRSASLPPRTREHNLRELSGSD